MEIHEQIVHVLNALRIHFSNAVFNGLVVWKKRSCVIIFNLFIDLPAALVWVHQGNNASLLLNLTWESRSIRWCFIKAPQPSHSAKVQREQVCTHVFSEAGS